MPTPCCHTTNPAVSAPTPSHLPAPASQACHPQASPVPSQADPAPLHSPLPSPEPEEPQVAPAPLHSHRHSPSQAPLQIQLPPLAEPLLSRFHLSLLEELPALFPLLFPVVEACPLSHQMERPLRELSLLVVCRFPLQEASSRSLLPVGSRVVATDSRVLVIVRFAAFALSLFSEYICSTNAITDLVAGIGRSKFPRRKLQTLPDIMDANTMKRNKPPMMQAGQLCGYRAKEIAVDATKQSIAEATARTIPIPLPWRRTSS
ncbi:hypothetical protein B0T21DRAFT_399473 [Apiosordaria backusii]|uniref:Uncharacterized protein n=1 Tax=Apiosordaria backusii TaxID=314023 RepID=A0AA40K459_9PEZI|nr:hypothetical protein B0T21DRAFT_399473 [Apiosordaria backusii]